MREAALCVILAVLSSQHHTRASVFNVWMHMPTLNPDGTVSVTCLHDSSAQVEYDGKLKSGGDIVCEDKKPGCRMVWEGLQNVTYTLWNLQASDEARLYRCQFSRMSLPIATVEGKPSRLFQACRIPFPPPRATNSSSSPTYAPATVPAQAAPEPPSTDPLVWVLTVVSALLALYAFIATILLLKLKASRKEVLYDTLLYAPVQHIQPRPQGQMGRGMREASEEYMDMREVQQKTWPLRDVNHNSQATANGIAA
ncbi:hypothetical protein ACEWY4_022774 [Coilia grayii]|uniref:Uncharacterized protein n=1 Tax=Coilia grayii TaxID=363190 RepID=A0ABD1J140_9TELE